MIEELPANHAKGREMKLEHNLIFKEEANAIIGACLLLYKKKGATYSSPSATL